MTRDNLTPHTAMPTGTPSKHAISRVMAYLGRRNKGRRKTVTPAGLQQRKNAAIASANKRRKPAPAATPTSMPKQAVPRDTPLVQSKHKQATRTIRKFEVHPTRTIP